MARELIERIIDGRKYEFSQFGAKEATRYLLRLSKIIGKPLAIAMGGIEGGDKRLADKSLNLNIIGEAISALTERLDEDETINLIEKFTSTPTLLCDGMKVDYNSHYEGRLDHMFKVLRAALEVQYGNFFGAMSGLLPQTPPKVIHPENRT